MANKPRNRPKAKPTWSDVKDRLADFDRARLLELVADLYAFRSDNKNEDLAWELYAVHGGDALVKTLLMCVILGVWRQATLFGRTRTISRGTE